MDYYQTSFCMDLLHHDDETDRLVHMAEVMMCCFCGPRVQEHTAPPPAPPVEEQDQDPLIMDLDSLQTVNAPGPQTILLPVVPPYTAAPPTLYLAPYSPAATTFFVPPSTPACRRPGVPPSTPACRRPGVPPSTPASRRPGVPPSTPASQRPGVPPSTPASRRPDVPPSNAASQRLDVPPSTPEDKPYVKKPPNAFMIFRKEQRPLVVAQHNIRDCAIVNKILGQMWHSLSAVQKEKYYELARKESQLHYELHPTWKPNKKVKKVKQSRPRPSGSL